MKTRLRKIVVGGTQYTWSISHFNCDGDGGVFFKVWKNKKEFFINELVHCRSFTPKDAELHILLREQKIRINKHAVKLISKNDDLKKFYSMRPILNTKKVKLYNGSHEPCDMLEGPCSCGAWHSKKEIIKKILKLKKK